ncbi:phytanoyl-CoA dioxygenase family protein [Micromonospora sp. NPDC005652]|uniref:phytanoyl-CoA dioxygenase family protein n=1 Tax=Micromonospora sp. NPDC005652 TaxID=3157046 RepID=UPI0033D42356
MTGYGDLVNSAAVGTDSAVLRRRMDTDGYLFLKGLLPAAEVTAARADILRLCAEAGWLDEDGADDGVVDVTASCQPPDPRYYAVYQRVISLESYNRLAHAQPLLDTVTMLLGHDDVIPRPARLARLIFPQPDVGATPPHQDYPHEQGTPEAYTAWIPIGRVSRQQGGLAMWPGSHRHGVFDHGFVPGVGGLGICVDGLDASWLTADFEPGDVVVFHSMTVHQALPNRTADRIRISADFRYQRASDPMTPHMLEPSGGKLSWDDVYAGWSSDDLKFYWRRWEVPISPYDYRYYRRRDEQVLELARAGDRNAREFLRTISARSSDPELRTAAARLLAELPSGGSQQGTGSATGSAR